MQKIFNSARTYVVTAVLIGVFIRLYGLDIQSLWFDEILTVLISKLNFSEMIQFKVISGYPNPHPPLHSLFLHFWINLFGESEATLRLSSALAGIFAIAITFIMSRKRLDDYTSACLTIITALSATLIFYSQETRAYIFIYLLSVVLTFWWIDIVKGIREANLKPILLAKYALVGIITCYTHYFGLLLVFLQLFYLLFTSVREKKYFENILITFLSISFCFSFWVVHGADSSLVYGKSSFNWLKPANLYYVEMFLDFIFNKYLLLLLVLPLAANLLSSKRKDFFNYKVKALLYLTLTPTIGLFLLSYIYPVFYARYFIIVLPAIYLLISTGITSNRYLSGIKSVVYMFAISVIALIVFLFIRADNIQDCNFYSTFCNNAYYKPHKQDWRGLASYIATKQEENPTIFVTRDIDLYLYSLTKAKPPIKGVRIGELYANGNMHKLAEYSSEIKNLYILSAFSQLNPYDLNHINRYYSCVYREFTGMHLYECESP